ncbi:hypothetical protein [Spirochaeta cellobiosiphila]|uniref:hypothetical protein n=1 Tax=Spirochaeta cellobiosiphila TaxID=504483 RepID=UPI0004292D18|nr:hypothetical protein [Spirochaeta cellobiosiphila]
MPIHPIDLQTLFIKMNQVGKEQADARNSVVASQEIQNKEEIKKHQQKDNSVNQTSETSDGPDKLKDDNAQGNSESSDKQDSKKSKKEVNPEQNVYKDPDLGSHIDITG